MKTNLGKLTSKNEHKKGRHVSVAPDLFGNL